MDGRRSDDESCSICTLASSTKNLRVYISHLRSRHSTICSIRCIYAECEAKTFRSVKSYDQHCRRHHRAELEGSSAQANTGLQDDCHGGNASISSSSSNMDVAIPSADNALWGAGPSIDVATQHAETRLRPGLFQLGGAAGMILKIEAKQHLTQATTAVITTELRSFTKTFANEIINKVVDASTAPEKPLKEVLTQCINTVCNERLEELSFVRTPYQREKLFKSVYGLVIPKKIHLGRTMAFKDYGNKRRAVEKEKVMYYVPISETIKSLNHDASFENLLTFIGSRHPLESCVENFSDGTVYQSHPLTKRGCCLPLVLYYDDLELCNPLGSYTKVHKLAMFYFTLTDIPMKYRSRLQSIFLLGIAYSADIKTFGIDKILEPFWDEMRQLSTTGLSLVVGGEIRNFHCCLAFICADTLAAHQLTGFKEGVGFSYRKCRHCQCSSEDMREKYYEEDFAERTITEHLRCAKITRATSVETGVNRIGKIFEVPHFNVFDGTPQDIMHVLLEGCVPYTLKEMLNHFILAKTFDLEQLNYKITNFPYTPLDINDKPSAITSQHLSPTGSLRQSAAQMWCLARLLPLMLFEYVDASDAVWQCFALLLHITALAMSPKFVRTKLGPATGFWCMRFEAKHAYFKQCAKKSNFKNIAKQLAKQHQYHQCVARMDLEMFTDVVKHGPLREMGPDVPFAELFLGSPDVKRCNWLTWNGIKFSTGCVVIVNCSNDIPIFAVVDAVVKSGARSILLVTNLRTEVFDEGTNSFICSKTTEHRSLFLSELLYHASISYYQIQGILFVPQKVDYAAAMGC